MNKRDANLQMHTNNANKNNKLIYPELSYPIRGILFEVHNNLGRFSREKQYAELLALKLETAEMKYCRELVVKGTGNIIDFLIEDKIILELKAKPFIVKDDYYQLQRYLQIMNIKLGLLVNFRNRYLKPLRILKIEKAIFPKFEH